VRGLSSAFTRLRVNALAVMMAGIFLPGSAIGCVLSNRHVTPCLARRAFRQSYDVNACWCRCVRQGCEQASADCIDPSYSVGTPNQRHCRLRGSTFVPRVCLHEFISAQAAPCQSRTHIRSVCSTRNPNTHTLPPAPTHPVLLPLLNTMASTNPANFANLPKDELKEIAAKGGHASHGAAEPSHPPGRNPDGTFTQGSEVAKELGAKGGHVAHEHQVAQAAEDSGVCDQCLTRQSKAS
jgi:general stress protein YciG